MTEWAKLKVTDLRAELKDRGLSTAGVKADLIARLTAATEEEENEQEEQVEAEKSPSASSVKDAEPSPERDAAPELGRELDAPDPTSDTPAAPSNPEPEAKVSAGSTQDAAPQKASPTPPLAPAPPPSELPRVDTSELVKDAQKRKRRSASPPPSTHDTKRTKVDLKRTPSADEAMDVEPSVPAEGKAGDSSLEPPLNPTMQASEQDEDESEEAHPALYAATSALYIKNIMRPLQVKDFEKHLERLAAAPGAEIHDQFLVHCFLDSTRTHALVQFSSTVAAQRVRASLHGAVFPKESNRKELWVDFIPSDQVKDWIKREEREERRSSARFEVVYDKSPDGTTEARLVEIRAGSGPSRAQAAPAANAPQPPTGPRSRGGIEGAPLGPRADQQRGRSGGTFRTPRINDPNVRTTRADPMIYWRPISEELAQRRIDNMRSYYSPDARITDDDKRNNINRYFFENGDSFVDRGKEIFAGIRPPHREREHRRMMREQRQQGGSSRLLEPSRRDRNAIPAPQSFRPGGGDRYMGSAARGDSWRGGNSDPRHEDRRYRDYRGRPGRRR